jgi:hypothetical protein
MLDESRSGILPEATQHQLSEVAQALDPIRLLRQVEHLQQPVWRCVVTPFPLPSTASLAPFCVERCLPEGSLPEEKEGRKQPTRRPSFSQRRISLSLVMLSHSSLADSAGWGDGDSSQPLAAACYLCRAFFAIWGSVRNLVCSVGFQKQSGA